MRASLPPGRPYHGPTLGVESSLARLPAQMSRMICIHSEPFLVRSSSDLRAAARLSTLPMGNFSGRGSISRVSLLNCRLIRPPARRLADGIKSYSVRCLG